jgi:CRISPR-associated endoribonuclease Cas6
MLYSFYLRLRPLAPAQIGASQGQHAHGLVLALINGSSPALAQKVHDAPGPKPFTVSPLLGKFIGHAPLPLTVLTEELYSIRVTALQEEVFVAILDGAIKHAAQPIRLEEASFQLVQLQDVPGAAPMVACQSFEELLECAQPQRALHLEFMSPSTFRTKGERNVLQPDPRLLVQSWLTRWNAFSPAPLDTVLIQQAAALRPAYTNVWTRSMYMGNHPELGFCGFAGYRLPQGIAEEESRHLTALAEFALYCGSGAKTSMGMGQTRRMGAVSGRPVRHRDTEA